MVLHQWQAGLVRPEEDSDITARSLMAIKSGATITTLACEEFFPQTSPAQCTAHHPQTTQAVYHAARTAMQMGQSLFSATAVEATVNMLTTQSTRWKIAGMLTYFISDYHLLISGSNVLGQVGRGNLVMRGEEQE